MFNNNIQLVDDTKIVTAKLVHKLYCSWFHGKFVCQIFQRIYLTEEKFILKINLDHISKFTPVHKFHFIQLFQGISLRENTDLLTLVSQLGK